MAGDVILGVLTLSTLHVALCTKTTCTASAGTKGEQATITCHFNGNESHVKDSISVHKLDADNKASILDCFWESDGHAVQCYNQSGYTYDVKDWRNLTVIIPEVNEKHVGQYVCQTMMSDADDHVSCELTLQDTSVSATSFPATSVPVCRYRSEKDAQCENCVNTVVIVSGFLVMAVLLLALPVLLRSFRKWPRIRVACGFEEKKLKAVGNCQSNATTIPLIPKTRLLIAGKTGNGKSTLGNTLLGKQYFQTGTGLVATTTTAESNVKSLPEGRFEVVEIPDICNSDLTAAKMENETSRLREFTSVTPAPYVVLVVRCDVVYTADEYALYNKVKEVWENPASFCDQLVVAFCFGDRLKCDERDLTTKVSSKLKTVLEDAGHRYVVFNNDASCTNEDKNTAVANLLHILRGRETQDLG